MTNLTKILTICIVLVHTAHLSPLLAQSIQLQGVVSGNHAALSDGTNVLSGSFGQPITNSDAGILTSGFYSATSNLLTENFAPTIDSDPYAFTTFDVAAAQTTISADIRDLDGFAYTSLLIRPIGGSSFDSVAMALESGDKFSYDITSGDFDDMGLEYYFRASDATDRVRRYPTTGSLYAYAVQSEIIFPNSLINLGRTSEDYRMISLPYEIGQNNVSTLFSALFERGAGVYDDTRWRLFTYDTATDSFIEYPGTGTQNLERGKGYWLLISDRNDVELNFGEGTAPANNQDDLFTMRLQSGWNMIGNPYAVAISWDDVLDYNTGIDLGTLKIFDGENGYVNGEELLAFQGGIVYLTGAATDISIPFAGQVNTASSRLVDSGFDVEPSPSNWLLNFEVQQGSRTHTLGGIGMHEEALDTKDALDDLNPPRFASYLEMNFPHDEHPLGFFSRDIVQPKPQHKWQLSLSSSEEGTIMMNWDPAALGSHVSELYLYDPANHQLLDMNVHSGYEMSGTGDLEIYYGTDVLIQNGPELPVIGAPYPNPVNMEQTTMVFPVSLMGQEAPYSVEVSIHSMEGRLVRNLVKDQFDSGMYQFEWNGQSENNENVQAGMYIYNIHIQTDNNRWDYTGKLLLLN